MLVACWICYKFVVFPNEDDELPEDMINLGIFGVLEQMNDQIDWGIGMDNGQ